MENLYIRLYELLKEEMSELRLGHSFNRERLAEMRELCHILTYLKYVDMGSTDVMQIFQYYDNL